MFVDKLKALQNGYYLHIKIVSVNIRIISKLQIKKRDRDENLLVFSLPRPLATSFLVYGWEDWPTFMGYNDE